MAISPRIILIPFNMVILDKMLGGYNILKLAKSGMRFGKNDDVNYVAPTADTPTSSVDVRKNSADVGTNSVNTRSAKLDTSTRQIVIARGSDGVKNKDQNQVQTNQK